jgi:glycosyltransferase involved in cell wall biosynthesis
VIKRVLICANPDLNYIDGSSIWAQTIALATAATGTASVDFLVKSKPERDELFVPLKAVSSLNIIDGTQPIFWNNKVNKRLSLPMMADLAVKLDGSNPYDVIIVRGFDIANKLLETPAALAKTWLYLTDIPQSINLYDAEQQLVCERLSLGCQRLLCQTEGFKALWMELVPWLDKKKVSIYSPVIPDLPKHLPPIASRPILAIYAGKFKGDWMTLEMAEAWPDIHNELPGSELVMIGDKIHKEPDRPDYQQDMLHALEHTTGLRWLGAQSREAVQQELHKARVGLSWRAESMNDTVEYSTKILEYGGAGCAAVLNRNTLHEQLLGTDYPLFANTPQEFTEQLDRALRQPTVAESAAAALKRVAERHTFSARVEEIRDWLEVAPKAMRRQANTKVLVAGHDLKFFNLLQKKLEDTGQFEFLTDQWQGHNKHDEAKSRALLEQADVIFCEWCLGNLKWYSHNKKPHQRLVGRFHAQEVRAPYISEANWESIDHVSFVSEHTRRQGLGVFSGFPIDKTSVIPNFLDDSKFTLKKKTAEARFTLGMVGIAPKSKRLDRALDLLESLLEEDDRYCLRVKGKHPLDNDWLLHRKEELAYYQNVFERINSNHRLRYKVIFDPPGDNVNDWFTTVGYIISPSEHESFHMAIGEGLLTGAKPIIWDWDGAEDVWGQNWIVRNIDDAKKSVINNDLASLCDNKKSIIMASRIVVNKWLMLLRFYKY